MNPRISRRDCKHLPLKPELIRLFSTFFFTNNLGFICRDWSLNKGAWLNMLSIQIGLFKFNLFYCRDLVVSLNIVNFIVTLKNLTFYLLVGSSRAGTQLRKCNSSVRPSVCLWPFASSHRTQLPVRHQAAEQLVIVCFVNRMHICMMCETHNPIYLWLLLKRILLGWE